MEALRRHAVSLILIHNHPSGDPTPSPDDLQITARIYQAGELLGIHLLDHIVIGGSEILQLQRRRIMEYMYRIRQQQRGRICYLRKHME